MTITNIGVNTFTVVDIRKSFEGFNADFRMIANRTAKLTTQRVEDVFHDVLKWAENKYLSHVDITLVDSNYKPIKAVRFKVDDNGSATSSDRAGGNDWQNLDNTTLKIIVHNSLAWKKLSSMNQAKFKSDNSFKCIWTSTTIDTSYSHLSQQSAQLYASNGYELKKENFK